VFISESTTHKKICPAFSVDLDVIFGGAGNAFADAYLA